MLFNSKISILLFALFLSSVLFNTSFPQQASYLDSLDGKFALQFQITNYFTLSSFQGTVLSGKYHFSKRDAVRLGVSLTLSGTDTETEINHLDTTTVDNATRDENRFDITINTQYIRYISIYETIAFYGGIGPFVNFSKQTRELLIPENGIEMKSNTETKGFILGLDVLVGVEWWFHKYMSLSAEYGLRFSYRSIESTIKDEVTEGKAESTTFYLTGNQVKFGISVYF